MTTITEVQKSPEEETSLLSSEERAIFSQIATKEPPYSQRAQALLAIDEGSTQAEAGIRAGLTKGQVRYWFDKFRKDGTSVFPEELLNQVQSEDAGEEEVQQEMPVADETAGPVVEVTVQKEDVPKAKKKSEKKPDKKSRKGKKSVKTNKTKKDKKALKGKRPEKKTKKDKSKKAKGKKGKSGKKKRKK